MKELNIVKQMVADGQLSQEVAEKYFPEIKESEGEKIRKRIIDALHGDVLDIEETDKAIAWLEKQGEQEHVIAPKFDIGDIIRNKITNEVFTITDRCISLEYYHDINHLHEVKFSEQDNWELVKHKPTWSEDDEQYLLVCKNALAKYQTTDKWDASIISHWLENKLKSVNPQNTWKPSEGQIKALEDSIEFLGCTKKVREDLKSLYEQLKKLREK